MKEFLRQVESLHLSIGWGLFSLRFYLRPEDKSESKEKKDAVGFFVAGEEDED